jgi:hypothetical protein
MEDSENIDVIDDITYYTEKFFKEIETLLKKLEKDEIFLKVDLTDEAVHDELEDLFNEEDPPIYSRLLKKYIRLNELSSDKYVLNAKVNFPDGLFKPYINLYLEVLEKKHSVSPKVDFLINLYKELKSSDFKKLIVQQRKYDHTKKTRNEKHIKDLFNYRSKLLVIRIALRYKEDYLIPDYKYDAKNNGKYNEYLRKNSELVKDDLNSFVNILKYMYKDDLFSYMWKLRYNPHKQFYYDFMIFLDGDEHTKDVAIAKKICGLWKDIVTDGNGECTNFNAYKKQHHNLGLGVKYSDRRDLVIQEAKIFIEHDYFVNSMLSGKKQRTFSKSHIPNKTRSGRPRKLKLL